MKTAKFDMIEEVVFGAPDFDQACMRAVAKVSPEVIADIEFVGLSIKCGPKSSILYYYKFRITEK